MQVKTIIGVLSLLVCQCFARNIHLDRTESEDEMFGDIRLTVEQMEMMKERGFLAFNKWPADSDGIVRIPYYLDENGFDQATLKKLKMNLRDATDAFAARTCIRWYKISDSHKGQKVNINRGKGCTSQLGMMTGKDNEISIRGCEKRTGSIIHEMAHTVGLIHTQSRTDRDQYIKVFMENVEDGRQHDFEMMSAENYGIPYDYRSLMHYGNNVFSKNGSFTITTNDPLAMFVIGSRQDYLRWSEALTINRAYGCEKVYEERCRDKIKSECQNDGFVLPSCSCKCPENTKGDFCETVVKDFNAVDPPKCGGIITTEQEIESKGFEYSATNDKCVFKIVAPECHLPSITFKKLNFYDDECRDNMLAVQVSSSNTYLQYCEHKAVPLEKAFVSETSTASVIFYTDEVGSRSVGFRAAVNFLRDPTCRPSN